MPKRSSPPTPVDAAISEARERMAAMAPGDVIQVPVNGGHHSQMKVADSVRYYGRLMWGKGHCQAMHRGLKGAVAIARVEGNRVDG